MYNGLVNCAVSAQAERQQEELHMKHKKFDTRQMVTTAMLCAILLMMSFTPLGYLNIGPLAISFNMIPVDIGAIVLGPVGGLILGAVFGTLGVVMPSFLIILIVAMFFSQIRENEIIDAAFKGMRPAVVGLIFAPVIGFVKGMRWWLIAISAAIALVIWHWGVSPVYMLALGAVAGIAVMVLRGKEVER